MQRTIIALLMVLPPLAWQTALAAPDSGAAPSAEHTGIELAAETMKWDFSRNGANVQEEVGPRVRLGMSWDNFRRRSFGWVYSGEADLMVGQTDQEDFTTAPTTERQINYYGLRGEGAAGIHFGTLIGINLLGGLGFDVTSRNLKTPTSGPTPPLANVGEYWIVVYSKFGLGLSNDFTFGHWRAEAGLKMPIYNQTIARVEGFDDVDFDPKRRGGLYANFKMNFGQVGRTHFGLSVYYEESNFGSGGTQTLTVDGVPSASTYTLDKSEARVLGARLAYFF